MYNDKFYVLDVKNGSYKSFSNYYNLLCFVYRTAHGAFGNDEKDKRWQHRRISIWSWDYSPNPSILKEVLYIAYDAFMNVLNCKQLEIDVLRKDVFMPSYKYKKGWRYYSLVDDINYMGFRNGPVPYTGKRGKYKYFRNVKTTQERRINYAHIEFTRGSRRNLPSSWEDIGRSDMRNKYSWKKQKKIKQWM